MSTAEFTAEQRDDVPGWWPSLSAGLPVFSDPRWLELFARSRGETGTWWFATGGDGRDNRPDNGRGNPHGGAPRIGLRGAVVGPDTRKSMNPHRWLFSRTAYHDGEPFDGDAAPPPRAWFPALLCSYPGLDTYPVGAGEDPELVRVLLDGIAGWAAQRGIALVAVGFVQPELAAFTAGAAAAGFSPVPVATRADLRLAGRDAAEVFGSYSTQQRNNLRRLRRKLAERGVEVAVLDGPLDHLDALVELRCEHIRQHGKEPSEAEERSWLGPLLTELGDRVTVFGAYDGAKELSGFSLFVDDGVRWTAFALARRDPDVYFELMYHAPTEHAAARGVPEISFGYGTTEAKRRRGCTLTDVPTWFRATDPAVRDWLTAAAART